MTQELQVTLDTGLHFDTPISSQDLCRAYGVRTTYKNASREARRLIELYDLPLRRGRNYRWVFVGGSD